MAEAPNSARQHPSGAAKPALRTPAGSNVRRTARYQRELRGSGWTAFLEIGDRVNNVGDRFFGIADLQRPRAASMILRAPFASTVRPCRYDSSAASMPESSSGVSVGASESTASTRYRPTGRSRSSEGTSLPFQVRIRARRGITRLYNQLTLRRCVPSFTRPARGPGWTAAPWRDRASGRSARWSRAPSGPGTRTSRER